MEQLQERAYRGGFRESVVRYYRRAFDFRGITTKREFWLAFMYVLFCSVILAFLGMRWLIIVIQDLIRVDGTSSKTVIVVGMYLLLALMVLVYLPFFSLQVRRLRDVGVRGRVAGVKVAALTAINIFFWSIGLKEFLLAYIDRNAWSLNTFLWGTISVLVLNVLMLFVATFKQDALVTRSKNPVVRFFLRTEE